MSLDLLPAENADFAARAAMNPQASIEPGIWTGFLPGVADAAMKGFAEVPKTLDMLQMSAPVRALNFMAGWDPLRQAQWLDSFTGDDGKIQAAIDARSDELRDAVKYWTPNPNEVGMAGQVIGGLIPLFATAAISPAIPIATAGVGTAQELYEQGVPGSQAAKAGAVQGLGMALMSLFPTIGPNLLTRMTGGAAFNVITGGVARAATGAVLEGTPQAAQYKWDDPAGATLDALFGLAFGAYGHVAVGRQERAIQDYLKKNLSPADLDAILAANQARHATDTTAPAEVKTVVDATAHAEALRKAIDDILSGKEVDVEALTRGIDWTDDPLKEQNRQDIAAQAGEEARQILLDAIAKQERVASALETPAFLRSADDLLALRPEERVSYALPVEAALAALEKPGFLRTAEEKITLDTVLAGRAFADSPLTVEAAQRLKEQRDLSVLENGEQRSLEKTLTERASEADQATKDSSLFNVAASCLMGEA